MTPTNCLLKGLLGLVLLFGVQVAVAQSTPAKQSAANNQSAPKKAGNAQTQQKDSNQTKTQSGKTQSGKTQSGKTQSGKTQSGKTKQNSGDKNNAPNISPKRRAELMRFVNTHHPELRPLLESLKRNRPAQFRDALRTLHQDIKKLQDLEKRTPNRYKKSLAQWTLRSKIKLLSAQLAFKKNEAEKKRLTKEIRSMFEQLHNVRVEQITADIDNNQARIDVLNARLKELKSNKQNEIQRQMNVIHKSTQRILKAQKSRPGANKANKPASKKPPQKTSGGQ